VIPGCRRRHRHRSTADELAGEGDRATRELIDGQLEELHDALRGVRLLGHCPPAALDLIASFGERLSAIVVAAYLNGFCPSRFVDARDFVTTDEQFTRANVIFAKTNPAAQEYFSSLWRRAGHTLAVVTGFIGRTEDGRTTTSAGTDRITRPQSSGRRSTPRPSKSGRMSTAS